MEPKESASVRQSSPVQFSSVQSLIHPQSQPANHWIGHRTNGSGNPMPKGASVSQNSPMMAPDRRSSLRDPPLDSRNPRSTDRFLPNTGGPCCTCHPPSPAVLREAEGRPTWQFFSFSSVSSNEGPPELAVPWRRSPRRAADGRRFGGPSRPLPPSTRRRKGTTRIFS